MRTFKRRSKIRGSFVRSDFMGTEVKIPDEALCPGCGKPMRVVRYEERARTLGLAVPERGIPSIECHGYQLILEDHEEAEELMKALEAHHASMEPGVPEAPEWRRVATEASQHQGA
jgi:hypothetical protein